MKILVSALVVLAGRVRLIRLAIKVIFKVIFIHLQRDAVDSTAFAARTTVPTLLSLAVPRCRHPASHPAASTRPPRIDLGMEHEGFARCG